MTDTLDTTAAAEAAPTAATAGEGDFSGHAIAFADRGFVWVGDCHVSGDWLSIKGARAVRRWGTSEGLNELAQKGPLPNTRLDAAADILVSRKALIGLIPTEAAKWAA